MKNNGGKRCMLKGKMDRAGKSLWKCRTEVGRKVHIEVKNRVSEKTPCDGRLKEGWKDTWMDTKFRGYSESLHAIHKHLLYRISLFRGFILVEKKGYGLELFNE